jgi:hypothetical protein
MKMSVKCTFVSQSMLAMVQGTRITCPMLRSLSYSGVSYGLQAARSFTGWSETTDVQIVCNRANATGCDDWFVEPIDRGRAIGRLMQEGGKQPSVHVGTFYSRFRIHITRP